MTKITVNKAKCIGCGICVSICPDIFEMGADGKSQVINEAAEGGEAAASSCPVGAITIE
ncbi:MAG: ferredoxin [Candidatus Gracilibacteria bacterium]|jgi:ferredoxin